MDIEAIKPGIQVMEDAYARAEKEKGADDVVAHYGDDPISYNRNEERGVGKGWQSTLAKKIVQMRAESFVL